MTTIEERGPIGYQFKSGNYYGNGRNELVSLVPSGVRKLLDVGCAGGDFGARLIHTRPGIEVWGIEPFPDVAARAKDKLTRVICGSVEDALDRIPDGEFDCITFNDVLEHLPDPWVVLKAIRPKLAAGGTILASIPNLRHFPVMKSLMFGGEFQYVEHGVLDSTHLRFFTKKSMQRMLHDSGYVVTKIEGLQWTRFPFIVSVLNRLTGRSMEDMHYVQFAIQAKPARD